MYLVDQAGNGSAALKTAAERLVARGTDEDSALRIDIDNEKAESFGVALSAVNGMLSMIFAGSEVNDFVLGSSLRPVIVQAAPEHRMQPEDIVKGYAINADEEMVPFASFMTTSWEPVAPTLQRYGGPSALEISGSAGEGESSGARVRGRRWTRWRRWRRISMAAKAQPGPGSAIRSVSRATRPRGSTRSGRW